MFKWTDGSVYEGEFFSNIIQGKGVYKWADGRMYCGIFFSITKGTWEKNKMQGYGEYSLAGLDFFLNYRRKEVLWRICQ